MFLAQAYNSDPSEVRSLARFHKLIARFLAVFVHIHFQREALFPAIAAIDIAFFKAIQCLFCNDQRLAGFGSDDIKAFPELMESLPETVQSMEPIIIPWSIPIAFGISVTVGVVFGLYPAIRAAAMNPIDALRHVG